MVESDFGENEPEINHTVNVSKLSRNLFWGTSSAYFCLIQTMILVVWVDYGPIQSNKNLEYILSKY